MTKYLGSLNSNLKSDLISEAAPEAAKIQSHIYCHCRCRYLGPLALPSSSYIILNSKHKENRPKEGKLPTPLITLKNYPRSTIRPIRDHILKIFFFFLEYSRRYTRSLLYKGHCQIFDICVAYLCSKF